MPYKDKAKNSARAKQSVAQLYIRSITVQIKKNDPDFDAALIHAANDANITQAEYLRQAAREKLIRDGYLTPDDK